MSLLRNVLKKNTATTDNVPTSLSEKSRRGLRIAAAKNTKKASDTKSVGGVSVYSVRSIAESVASFTSTLFGQRVPKRRRPDVSTLGVPKWYNKDPPAPLEMPGTEVVDLSGRPYTAAHAVSKRRQGTGKEDSPYLTMVLYSHATGEAQRVRYFNDATIKGELRLRLPKRDTIASIDVWCICKTESNFNAVDAPILNYHANVWSRDTNKIPNIQKGVFPEDHTFVFPFEMPQFPKDIKIQKPDSTDVTRIILPPTYRYTATGFFSSDIKYYIGVNIQWAGFGAIDDEWDVPFLYFPLRRPVPREPTLFPFISDREDWPLKREEIGGWTITPFGGRGRFRDEMVEIEGLLGVQAPEVYSPGQTLRYSILLWSKSIPALEALSETIEDNVDAVFVQSATCGLDVLQPKNSARKNRDLKRLAQGRIWRTDDGPPLDDTMPSLRDWPKAKRPAEWGAEKKEQSELLEKQAGPSTTPTSPMSRAQKSRFQQVITAAPEEEEGEAGEDEISEKRPSSPASSEHSGEDEDGFEDLPPQEATIRLDGDVRIPDNLQPSFRYKWIGREYALTVSFTHPEYQHISPAAASIYAETPIWVVLGGTAAENGEATGVQDEATLRSLSVVGQAIPVDESAIFAPLVVGKSTTKTRPLLAGQREAGF